MSISFTNERSRSASPSSQMKKLTRKNKDKLLLIINREKGLHLESGTQEGERGVGKASREKGLETGTREGVGLGVGLRKDIGEIEEDREVCPRIGRGTGNTALKALGVTGGGDHAIGETIGGMEEEIKRNTRGEMKDGNHEEMKGEMIESKINHTLERMM